MPSRTLNRSHQVGFLSVPSSPHDATTQIDDLGAVMYTAHTNYSNQSKYGTIDFGIEPSFYAALPGRVLKYTTGNDTMGSDGFTIDTVTARANGWLVHDNAGAEIAYGGGFLTNCGSVGFQNDWKSRALTYLSANPGVDGVWIDNFEMSFSNYSGTAYPIKDQSNNVIWSNNTDFQNDMIAFSNNAHKAVKDAGYQVVPNAKGFISGDVGSNDGSLTKGWIDRFHANVTGMTCEYWNLDGSNHSVFTASSPFDSAFKHAWNEWMSVMDYAQSYGLGFYPVDEVSPTDNANIRFLRASFLMNWNGGQGSVLFNPYLGDAWNADMARDPGQPQSAKVSMGPTGCWKRQYEHYMVYVNANATSQVLDGHTIASGDGLFV